jgi:putative SOS response-associated peptidase YedK
MCYHTSTPKKKDLKNFLPEPIVIDDYEAHYHLTGFSHPELPVMLQKEPDRVQQAVWGFIPAWAKPDQTAELMNKTLNARAETIFTTPMFRGAAPGHRCLIFVDGFFEWKHEKVGGKLKKIPHYIRMPDHKPFALGGLYSHWIDKNDSGEVTTTCSIITTEANELMATIHNSKKRMPLVMNEDDWNVWLDPKASEAQVKHVMRPFQDGKLDAHEISTMITAKGMNTDVAEIQNEANTGDFGTLF